MKLNNGLSVWRYVTAKWTWVKNLNNYRYYWKTPTKLCAPVSKVVDPNDMMPKGLS